MAGGKVTDDSLSWTVLTAMNPDQDITSVELACIRADGEMNVFMTDFDPAQAARWHTDRHVWTMVMASAQILSTAWHNLDNDWHKPMEPEPAPTPWLVPVSVGFEARTDPHEMLGSHWMLHGQRIYARSLYNHPAVLWAQACRGNYDWLWRLAIALTQEYKHRFGRYHRATKPIWTLEAAPPSLAGTSGDFSEVPPCMPEHFRQVDSAGFYDTVASYRHYLNTASRPLHAWTNRELPPWLER